MDDFPGGVIPYGPIHRALVSSSGRIYQLFKQYGSKRSGKTVLPISKAVEAGVGECLEKAVLAQLASQRGRESFLVNGVLGEDGEIGVGYHAFNVILRDGKLHIVDVQNPLHKDETGRVWPYAVPVFGINSLGEFQVPNDQRHGRTYALW